MLAGSVSAAPFSSGNVVVYRVGTGSAALSNASAEVFLDEYTPAGTLVQSLALPTADDGANQSITASGTATSGGLISNSSDGQYIIVTGYDSVPGVASITGSATTSVVRVIGRVAASGAIDASTTTTSFSADNIRGATSTDGTAFWACGANTGVIYLPLSGSGAGTIVSSSSVNNRSLGIFGGQLYVSSGSGTNTFRGVNAVGAGLPTTTGQTISRLTGLNDTDNPSSFQFYFADLDAGVAGIDTLYIADDGVGALTKWSLVSGTWTKNNTIGGTADDYRGLTGFVNGVSVTLYATRDNASSADTLVSLLDSTGYNASMTATPTTVATAATNTAFRGVAVAPVAVLSTPVVTIAATDADAVEAPTVGTGTFRISRTGSTASALSVSYTVTSGVGQAVSTDYTPTLSGTAMIAASESFVDITLTPVDDFVLEGSETVVLTITDTVDYDLGATTSASITITDDETNIDLSRYVRVGRYDLPEPTRTTAPSGNLLGQESSGVAYNWDTDTLFVVGDGGTSVTEVSKTGALVSTMTLSGNGDDFLDTEGITYIGGGQFVMTEERLRQAVKFTYVAGGTLTPAAVQRVKLGTTIGNVGLEGLSYDPQTSGFLFAKEADPQGLFQTTIDFVAGTASNGSGTTVNSTNLFSPALASLDDMSDVYAFSNLPAMTGQAQVGNLLILSQESGLIRHVDRSGSILSTLTLVSDAGNPLTIQNQTHEGVTMDREGRIYVVSENGGGDIDHPQLWVYAPASVTNTAPTALVLSTSSTTIPDSTSTASAVKMTNFTVTDSDGVGVNTFSLSGADAADFQVIGTALYLKAGTVLNGTSKPSYTVTVNVDDTSVGITPDAFASFTLNVSATTSGAGALRITEVAPWSSGNSPGVAADWFELTNTGSTAVDITGWKMNDSAASFGSAGPLNGITSLAPGESVIFVDGQTKVAGFLTNWFGASPPASLQVGYYGGPGLSTGGDSVTIYDASGTLQARVDFGASPAAAPYGTFDNTAGLNNATITLVSALGQNGAFTAAATTDEIGSPGAATVSSTVLVSITATDASATEAGSDPGTFRISRTGTTIGAMTVLYSIATGSGQATSDDYTPALVSPATIADGASFVDVIITPVDDASVEGSETVTLTLGDTGSYDVGSPASATVTIADNDTPNTAPTAVALINTVTTLSESTSTAADVRVADITVTDDAQGTNTLSVSGTDASFFTITGASLYLKSGTSLSFATKASYSVTVNVDDTTVGSTPDASTAFTLSITAAAAPPAILITEVHPSGSSASYGADWFELTNTGSVDVDITGWQVDDSSNGTVKIALRGVTVIPAGKSAIFLEGAADGSTDATIQANFSTAWFGTATLPTGMLVGGYGGSGIGLSASGDAVNIFDASGNRVTGVAFGAATVGTSFDNKTAALGSTTLPLPTISTLSVIGTNGAFRSASDTETGSPGFVSEFRLQLLHLSDGEAGLLASETAPKLAALADAFDDDYANTLILSGGDNWLPGPFLAGGTDASVRDELNAVTGSTISLAASTNHPIAAVDIAIHNAIGVEVSAIGNHEFDLGSRVFRDSFTPGSVTGWAGANFPHLSANLDFSGDSDLSSRFTNTLDGGTTTSIPEASTLKGRIAPSVVITKGGEKIGIVGATTQILESISSPSGTEVKGFPTGAGPNGEVDDMALLAGQLQPVINELIAEGVDKIVLMAHLQVIANEQALAPLLTGVDVILSAGSNTRLGDADDEAASFPGHTASFAGTYPLVTAGADGKPTLIVNTDNEYTYLGRLVVDFDANGNIITASLPGQTTVNGAYAAVDTTVAAAWGVNVVDLPTTAFAAGTKGAQVKQLTDAVSAVITAKDGDIAGYTDVYLQGERIAVRNQETNLGNISSDANLNALREALGSAGTYVASLKNGGGIRAQIGTVSAPDPVTGAVTFLPPAANVAANKPEGAVSRLDIENSLRFNNLLMAFDTTAAGLKAILEHGVAVLGNQGRFPQIGGVRFSYDPSRTAGDRVRNAVLIDENDSVLAPVVTEGIVSASAPATITLVTLNFLANGGDSYPMKANGENFRYLLSDGTLSVALSETLDFTATVNVPANALGEQATLFDYFEDRYPTAQTAYNQADTAPADDTRIQNLSTNSEDLIYGAPVISLASANVTVNQGSTSVTLNLARTSGSAVATSVLLNTADGTATAGIDYTALVDQLVSFDANTNSASITITLSGAPITVARKFTATITSGASGAAMGSVATATIRILTTDTIKPVVTIGASTPLATVPENGTDAVTIAGTVKDNLVGIDRVEVSLNGGPAVNATLTPNATGASYTLSVTAVGGSNTVRVQAFDANNNASLVVSKTFTYVVNRALTVVVDPGANAGSVIGLKTSYQVGKPVALTAVAKAGFIFDHWSGAGLSGPATEVPNLSITFTDALAAAPTITAHFIDTPFDEGVIGTFNGLVIANGSSTPDHATNGMISGLKVSKNGAFTGTLKIDGLTLNLIGLFDNTGVARFGTTRATTLLVTRPSKPAYELALTLDVASTGNSQQITGTLIQRMRTAVVSTSLIVLDRAFHSASNPVPANYLVNKGFYTVVLPARASQAGLTAEEYPQGDGVGSLTLTALGQATLAATLADGTVITASAPLSKNLSVPLYTQLYESKAGCLGGLVTLNDTLADSDVAGTDLFWFRPYQKTHHYPWGWPEGIEIDLVGAKYAVPAAASVLPLLTTASPNATLTFTEGGLASPIAKDVTISTANKVTHSPASDKSFTLAITAPKGTIAGTFTHEDGSKPKFLGAILQKGANRSAFGHFLTVQPKVITGLGESGAVSLMHRP